MSKKQKSISDRQISQEEDAMKDSLVLRNHSAQSKIRSLNDLNRIKGVSLKNSYFNESLNGTGRLTADKEDAQRRLNSNREYTHYRSEQKRVQAPQFLTKSGGAGGAHREQEAPNWKKKDEAEIIEYQEISEKETTRENHERPEPMLEAPDPAALRQLEAGLEALGRQELGLQGRLDSLEAFLFKEKEFDWGEKRNRPYYEGSSMPSITSVRDLMGTPNEGRD